MDKLNQTNDMKAWGRESLRVYFSINYVFIAFAVVAYKMSFPSPPVDVYQLINMIIW